ncbi:MAG: TolB family protein [Myxococcaceae bacterium]
MRGTTLMLALALLPSAAPAQLTYGPTLTGIQSTVNSGPGDQTDPHVSCDTVAYTSEVSGASQIRYYNLRTQGDAAIPNGGAFDSLSDVSGSRIVFTRTVPGTSAIFLFDTSTPATAPRELAPRASSSRRAAAVGGNTVAWQDFSDSATGLDSELVVHDLATGTTTRLTHDVLLDRSPAVSTDGNTVVFAKCETTGTTCDVYKSVRTGSTWGVPVAVTGAGSDDTLPDTNGTLIVYGSLRGADQDIVFQPVAGGAEQQLLLPGEDGNPNISGALIAFEHLEPGDVNRDILLYDVSTQTAYRLTSTPSLDETLNDISVCGDGLVRVVYTVREGSGADANSNVYAFSFRLTAPPPACSNGSCSAPGTRPLLTSFEVKRGKKHGLDSEHETFKATPGLGLLCVDNQKGTGWVVLNCGDRDGEYDSNDKGASVCFKPSATSIERKVNLNKSNRVAGVITGDQDRSFQVRVYGTDKSCTASSARPEPTPESLGVWGMGTSHLRSVAGQPVGVSDDGTLDLTGLLPPGISTAGRGSINSVLTTGSGEAPSTLTTKNAADGAAPSSCSSTGDTPLLAALAMWAVWSLRRTSLARASARAPGRAATRR